MRVSTIVILLGILGLGVFIAFFDRGDIQSTTDGREASRQRLFRDLDRISGLLLEKDDVVCDLRLEGEQWTFVDPKGAPARNGSVRQILDALRAVKSEAQLTDEEMLDQGLTLKKLGLDPPVARIDFITEPDPYTLWLGERNAFSSHLYARDGRSDQVVTIDARILDVFPAAAIDLRDTAMGFPKRQDVVRFELERAAGFLQLARDDDGLWTMRQPLESRVDQERVQAFFASLEALKMESIITDTPDDLGSYGLVEPSIKLRWWVGEELNPETLHLGADEDGQKTFAQMSRYPTVFTLPIDLRKLLEAPANSFRDKRILPLSPGEIDSIRIKADGEKLTLGREGDTWEIIELAPKAIADKAQVEALLEDWCKASALRFPADELLAELQAKQEEYSLTFMLQSSNVNAAAEDAVPRQIELYDSPDPSVIWAYLPQEKALYEIPAQLKAGLSLSPINFYDRTVTKIDPVDVLRLSHEGPRGMVHVIRAEEDKGWQIEDDACILNEKAFLSLLETACAIEARSLVNLKATELANYGLEQPVLQLTLGLRGSDVISNTLVLGKTLPVGGSRYAMLRGGQVIYELDEATCRLLMQPFCVKL